MVLFGSVILLQLYANNIEDFFILLQQRITHDFMGFHTKPCMSTCCKL